MKTISATVLIVEDHRDLAANVGDYLEVGGFTVDFATDGITALQLCEEHHYDAIVLDIMLPGIDGFEVCRRLRQEMHRHTPIIMLTARDTINDKVNGFDLGADDYLIKPFEMRELEARLIAMIRRQRGELEGGKLTVADLSFDLDTMRVMRGDKLIKLSPITLHILRILMRESPKIVSRERLEAEVWGDDAPDSDTLRSHLYNLRKNLDKPFKNQLMHTLPGVGYKLCREEDL
ncbi:response regulator transcription factor [Methylophaga nitratireducenticrescens]|uniref:Response regulator with CheY-like receiver domain and winged-helix DNA-binding domain n=1 Tax=Methylophaga nitratireducenticrescens TaxID=754476 RepID=I1XIV0_METNJ|nr:response regulator transcription factor [Methylophaga nitratireducenticrescens]AFI84319.1 DNA-binding response regulator [Methylophaga nitratireducenticrescens]AUZ84392.1 DNA-binding response regulator [Methylophaga nitratireducenticrescens]